MARVHHLGRGLESQSHVARVALQRDLLDAGRALAVLKDGRLLLVAALLLGKTTRNTDLSGGNLRAESGFTPGFEFIVVQRKERSFES